jgi:hypothetical protein
MLRKVCLTENADPKEMKTVQTKQIETDPAPARSKQTPGDDGFQSLSARFTGITLSPEDLSNLHQAQLIGEFFQGGHPTGNSTADKGRTNH